MKERSMKRAKRWMALVLIVVLTLSVSAAAYAAVTIKLGRTTMVSGTRQRLFVSGGKGTVSNTDTDVIKLSRDSASLILTARKPGLCTVKATIGNVTKSFRMKVLSEEQTANRALKRVREKYAGAKYSRMVSKDGFLYVWINRPQGNRTRTMKIRINLNTGNVMCFGGFEYFSGVPKSFNVF